MGMLAQTPVAGVAWQALHYLEGLRRLGCNVFYVEDNEMWPYDPVQNAVTADPRYALSYLAGLMDRAGLIDRWAYRAGALDRRVFGMSQEALSALWGRADALLNVTGATWLRDEHANVPVRIYLETDPVVPQIEFVSGHTPRIEHLAAHTHHFTYAESLGRESCLVPVPPIAYRPTRQPIVLDWWPVEPDGTGRYTTVGSWRQSGRDVVWKGERYSWSKDREFMKFLDLPQRTGERFELALAHGDPEGDESPRGLDVLASHGWKLVDGLVISGDLDRYRLYIATSRGEFTVAKDQNVRLRSGWFSDRSACYLAAGKPVITQDTGFGDHLPTGRGLFAFRTMNDVLTAIEAVEADYSGNSLAAREIAREYFTADRVLDNLLASAGLA